MNSEPQAGVSLWPWSEWVGAAALGACPPKAWPLVGSTVLGHLQKVTVGLPLSHCPSLVWPLTGGTLV
jgi:hypothetical protein